MGRKRNSAREEDAKVKRVEVRSENQGRYLRCIRDNGITFCLGPAGTGKTYLAVYAAVKQFTDGNVDKIVLCRPAVQSGEDLGFLPGDLREKVDPYLRPLHDAFEFFFGKKDAKLYLQEGNVEIAPLAYMRGRTFNNSFVILDEAQNSTIGQMKMFLTRMGQGSKMVINGDVTQIDLPYGNSGLRDADRLFSNVEGIGWVRMNRHDVVRHPLVQKVVDVYERDEERKSGG